MVSGQNSFTLCVYKCVCLLCYLAQKMRAQKAFSCHCPSFSLDIAVTPPLYLL